MSKAKVYVSSNGFGFDLKNQAADLLRSHFEDLLIVEDVSGENANRNSCDSFVSTAVDIMDEKISKDEKDSIPSLGLLVCRSGMSMMSLAGRKRSLRPTNVSFVRLSTKTAKDCNVLCCGAAMTSPEDLLEAVGLWLESRSGNPS